MRKLKEILILCVLCVILVSCNNSNSSYESLPETVDFNFHIKPILVQNCYLCHGPDPSSRKADLRLDTFEGAIAELESGGHSIVPGKPSKSVLLDRVTNEDSKLIMPPVESNLKLTSREIALLNKWIKQGAEWKQHWAFIKPVSSISSHTLEHPIDSLIDINLDQKGLLKSKMAKKHELIRRLSIILTGLPPKTETINNFIKDTTNVAYEKLVDHYLNSSAYGERWARHWMDLVRYAETRGHEFDFNIEGSWRYRDYLIRAFNEDVPYDQFLKEHLAGDLISTKRYNSNTGINESQLGPVFYNLGEGVHSPVDIRQDEADRIDNMIDVTTKTFQGLTVSCARCHDHKFDPITAADYYALYGIMESTRFSDVPLYETKNKKQVAKEIKDIQDYVRNAIAEEWGDKIKLNIDNKIIQKDRNLTDDFKMLGDFRGENIEDWSVNGLAFDERTTFSKPIINAETGKLSKLLEKGYASSETFGKGVFGVLRSPNFVIDDNFITVKARGFKSTIRIIIDNFQIIRNPIYGSLNKIVNNPNKFKNVSFNVAAWKGHKAYIEVLPGIKTVKQQYSLPQEAFIDVEYAFSSIKKDFPKEIPFVNNASSHIVAANKKIKQGHLKQSFPELISKINNSEKLKRTLIDTVFFSGVYDGYGIKSPVFDRGSYKTTSQDSIPRRFLSVLPMGDTIFESIGSGRLELAEAMLNKDNPLTSRVMVNRIWHHIFGAGIVETVDNFGLQGKIPSNPELLDYLAFKFQNEGWSIKSIIKHIVTSETFKRSTIQNETSKEIDPKNVYLSAFPVRRLEAEAIRDAILFTANNLDSTMYGKSIPVRLTSFMKGRGRTKSGPLDGDRRRSIYQEIRRNFLDPTMLTFDRPIPFSTFGKRNVTNVPSQSLVLMNHPFVIQQAKVMAEKLLENKLLNTHEKKIKWIYMNAFSREPSSQELEKALIYIETLRKRVNEENDDISEILYWKEFCHSIFNLKEFIYLI